MSGKHNTQHFRSRSRYRQRLQARGLDRSPMPSLDWLRNRQIDSPFYPRPIPSDRHVTYNPGRDK